ncbi:hypothetical protein AB4305_06900 [Nocardia sp. 2YAB30]|uniref:hypothetical protein n=1 Tax=unclassified Nocardia TaxID=2637762 RepID=UPI003F9A8ACA
MPSVGPLGHPREQLASEHLALVANPTGDPADQRELTCSPACRADPLDTAERPYHLLGWLFGRVTAYEIVVQLRRDGEHVALLAMMDSYIADPPGTATGDAEQVPGRADRRSPRRTSRRPRQRLGRGSVAVPQKMTDVPEPFASFGAR